MESMNIKRDHMDKYKEYQKERDRKSLFEAFQRLPEDDGSVWQWICRTYAEPFYEEHKEIERQNVRAFMDYPYLYGYTDADTACTEILWYEKNEELIFWKGGNISIYEDDLQILSKERVLVMNPLNIEKLTDYKNRTEYQGNIPNYKEPIYLYYDRDIFEAVIQCMDFTALLENGRIVLLIGEEAVKCFFEDKQTRMPVDIIGHECWRIGDLLKQMIAKRKEDMGLHMQESRNYYKNAVSQIHSRILSKTPHILFLTSYFTNVVKNHTRDCKAAAENMGLQTELLIEKDAIFSVCSDEFAERIDSFRPDIIFCIDHFRFEYSVVPKEVVWVCWAQDPLEHIMSMKTPAKLGDRDFILNHFISWKEFQKVGYLPDILIDAPIPANKDIYKKYELTPQERERYACDICFVCHASDADARMREFIERLRLDKDSKDRIYQIYEGYWQFVYESGVFFYNKNMFIEFIDGAFIQKFGIKASPKAVQVIADDMFISFNQRVYRQTLVDWIIDAGFTDIKLWGNGWQKDPKYQKYAMGPAENGEMLSKVYQSSKIVVGNNILTTSAARAWETMLSGGFYMSNYIPQEDDVTDIRKIITPGKDVVMFYDKEDLVKKLHYYLEHESEREKMARRGRVVALEKMTFDKLMQKTIAEIAKRWGQNNHG